MGYPYCPEEAKLTAGRNPYRGWGIPIWWLPTKRETHTVSQTHTGAATDILQGPPAVQNKVSRGSQASFSPNQPDLTHINVGFWGWAATHTWFPSERALQFKQG